MPFDQLERQQREQQESTYESMPITEQEVRYEHPCENTHDGHRGVQQGSEHVVQQGEPLSAPLTAPPDEV